MVNVDIDWPVYINQFKQVPKEKLAMSIAVSIMHKRHH